MHSYLPVWLPRSIKLLMESTEKNGHIPTDMLITSPRVMFSGFKFETNFNCEYIICCCLQFG